MGQQLIWRGQPIAFEGYASLAHEHAYGRAWYDESGASVAAYADTLGVPSRYVCDVIAILSPRVSVAQNVKLARLYLETGKAPGAMRARLDALARYESSGIFTGPKVNAFADALDGDSSATVIDAWMFRLFNAQKRGAKQYREVANNVKAVALELDWPNAETQAALWCGARSLCGYSDSYSPLEVM